MIHRRQCVDVFVVTGLLASAVLWVISSYVVYWTPSERYRFHLVQGCIQFRFSTMVTLPTSLPTSELAEWARPLAPGQAISRANPPAIRFGVGTYTYFDGWPSIPRPRMWFPQLSSKPPVRFASVPLWIPTLAFSVVLFFRHRKRQRIPPGHCKACRYNLTGNVSGVCPECGVRINAQARCEVV